MIRATDLARAGCKYLGEKYSVMDCQKFVRQCMADEGLSSAPAGSNKLYRTMTWTGTPEECKARFGRIPTGAFLFIHAFDGGEEARGYHDGKGNASHIGIYTAMTGQKMVDLAMAQGNTRAVNYNYGDGAIHSSSKREHMATSDFAGKSIKGGWNKIGLWDKIDYGEKINAILNGSGQGKEKEMDILYYASVSGGNEEKPINMRSLPNSKSKLIKEIPQGHMVSVLEEGEEWDLVEYGTTTGYVMKVFVHKEWESEQQTPEGQIPEEHVQPGETVTIMLSYEKATEILPILEAMVQQLVAKIGRG
jgi:hypothetical protein